MIVRLDFHSAVVVKLKVPLLLRELLIVAILSLQQFQSKKGFEVGFRFYGNLREFLEEYVILF